MTADDLYQMSEQFFPHRGVPVLFRDILYNLLGYFYAVGDTTEETVDFYSRLIKDNKNYVKRKEDIQYYMDLGCKAENVELAEVLYEK